MIANTRKMRKIQEIIESILREEVFLCDALNGAIDDGVMTEEKIQEAARIAKKQGMHETEIVHLTKEEIMANPYLQNIKVPNVSSNRFKLSNKRIIRPGIVTKYKQKQRDLKTMRQVNSYFVCDKSLRFPGISEGEQTTCWMTVEPCEIESFRNFIEEATGDVLLLGCGLGYVAYMLSIKEAVTSITIVDNNQDVLDLFTTHILPQFDNKEKIKTVNSDGLDYLRNTDLSIFNNVNVDIWYDTIDMLYTYLRCLEIERENPTVNFSYWLEDELKFDIQKSILLAATRQDCVAGKENSPLPLDSLTNVPGHNFLSDVIGKDLVCQTPINSYEDLYNLVDIKDLRGLLFCWYANNLDKVESQEKIDMSRLRRIHSNMTRAHTQQPTVSSSKVYFK